MYSETCVKRPPSKRPKIGFQCQLSLNAGQKYCRMHSAILSTFIKLPFVIKIFVVSSCERPFYTGFTVYFYFDCDRRGYFSQKSTIPVDRAVTYLFSVRTEW